MVSPRLHYVCLAGGRGFECGGVSHTPQQRPGSTRWHCDLCGARWRATWSVVMEVGVDGERRFCVWDDVHFMPLRPLPPDLIRQDRVRAKHIALLT